MATSTYTYSPYHQRGARRWLVSVFLLVSAFFGGIVIGKYYWEEMGRRTGLGRDVLMRQLAGAKSIIDQLKRENAVYENASLVDQLAVQNTLEDLKKLQEKLSVMEKELEFYRRIVAPENHDYELRIQDLRLFQGQRLALTLSRKIGRLSSLKASAQIQFTGRLNGKRKVLDFQEVDQAGRKKLEFSFRYFQTETANVKFPDKFELQKVTVTAVSLAKNKQKISKSWRVDELDMDSEVSISSMSESKKLN